MSGYNIPYSHLFFDGLHMIMRVLATGPKSAALRSYVLSSIKKQTHSFKNGEHFISLLDVYDRHTLVEMTRWLFDDWPRRFISSCKYARFYGYDMFPDMQRVPYWLRSVLHDYIYEQKPKRRTSDSEIAAVISYLKNTNREVTERNVSRLIGSRNLFQNRKKKLEDFE